jgi:hypothetical protein
VILTAATQDARTELDSRITELERSGAKLGIQIEMEGRGVLFSRAPHAPRSAASAIKSAVALDLFAVRGDLLDTRPVGVDHLLRPGTHPAFRGFPPDQLERARGDLVGRTYWELARIMMGRTPAGNEVYNAACNLIMIKLGGPRAIGGRLRGLDPSFAGFDINRYMGSWNGDGDNTATPEALVSFYRMVSGGAVPGLNRAQVEMLRTLLLHDGDGGPGTVYEKMGTLFPKPMVRVRAGYLQREAGNLVYAVMGEIPESDRGDPAELFVELMNAVDSVTVACLRLGSP